MSRREALHLQLELLRMRGAIERADVAAAMADVRRSTLRIAQVAATASRVAATLSARTAGPLGVVGALAGALGGQSLWASLALAAVRTARRHPLAAAAVVAGAAAWIGLRTRGRDDAREPRASAASRAAKARAGSA